MADQCGNCRFWNPVRAYDHDRTGAHQLGDCRRHAPLWSAGSYLRHESRKWPHTQTDHWCGDYEPSAVPQ